MKKSFLWGLVALMLFSLFVISCQKEDNSLKEKKSTEIKKEETPEKEEGNSSSSENSNEGNNGESNDNSNGSNHEGDNNNSDQNNNQDGNNDTTDNNQVDNNVAFVSKVLVEDVTGTWCGYCPAATRAIQRAKSAQTPLKERFVVVAIHNRNGRRDPMEIQKSYGLLNLFRKLPNVSFTGFPFLIMNRNQQLYASNAPQHIFERLEKTPTSPIGIKISSQLGNNGGNISVSFKTTEQELTELKYHIFVTQDNLIYGQSDYKQGYDSNFKHDEVLRDIHGEVTGNALGTLTKGQEVTKANQKVSYNLLQNNDLDKVKVVVFVTNAAGTVINVQEAKANQTKDYQYVK